MNRKYSISLLSVAIIASFALFVACSNSDGPTSAGMDFQPAMSDMPGSSGSASTGSGAGLNVADWRGDLNQEGRFVRGVTTNIAKGPRYIGLACFMGQNFDIDSQTMGTDNHFKISLVEPGETFSERVALQCGHNQCDLFFDITEDQFRAMQGANFGSKLIKGASFNYTCEPVKDTCEPTPVPEGFVECISDDIGGLKCTKPNPEPETPCCTWNEETCQWDCPPCEELLFSYYEASGDVKRRLGKDDVTADFVLGHGTYEISIMLKWGRKTDHKEKRTVEVPCGSVEEVNLSWRGLLWGAQVYAVINPVDGGSLPNKEVKLY